MAEIEIEWNMNFSIFFLYDSMLFLNFRGMWQHPFLLIWDIFTIIFMLLNVTI